MQAGDEISLIDYLTVALKQKKLIISMTLIASLLSALISLLMPKVYKAEAKLLLPSGQTSPNTASQVLSQLSSVPGIAIGGLNIKTTNDLYTALLKSRPVLDKIIERFDLHSNKTTSLQSTRDSLLMALKTYDDKKSGILTIGVEHKDPKMSASLTNAFVEELKSLILNLAVTEAGERRLFFEEQLKSAKESLIKAEESLRGFQEKTGAIRMDEQATAVIGSVSELRARISGKEVELKVMRTYATQYNPDIQMIEEEIRGLKAELNKLETKGSGHNPESLMPAGKIPAIGTEYIRRLREFKYSEAIYEILLKQYEVARLDEARDSAVIQVIEEAIPPENRLRPKRTSMVITGTLIGFILSVLTAFLMHYIQGKKAYISSE
ncbi:MAG: hypothetical protein HY805_07275 [Nitrospirae bacterium]|nr:hypothetical protein [Nitrospirota bacterium]